MTDLAFARSVGEADIFYASQCDSTNTLVRSLPELPENRIAVVYTYHQTKGRGQGNNLWLSEPGLNLAFTLRIGVENSDLISLNKAISIGVCEAISKLVELSACIKWPNDIIIKNKKVCGMLHETGKVNDKLMLFAGIGINVNQQNWPRGLGAAGVCEFTGKMSNLDQVLDEVIGSILLYVNALNWNHTIDIRFNDLLWRINQDVWIDMESGEELFARILGVDQQGRLVVNDQNKERLLYHGMARLSKKNL